MRHEVRCSTCTYFDVWYQAPGDQQMIFNNVHPHLFRKFELKAVYE